MTSHRGREHMLIVQVRQSKGSLVRLPVLHLGVVEVGPHLFDQSCCPCLSISNALLYELGEFVLVELGENLAAPERSVEILYGQTEQEVALLTWPEDAGVEECREHWWIPSEIPVPAPLLGALFADLLELLLHYGRVLFFIDIHRRIGDGLVLPLPPCLAVREQVSQ